jgi:translocator protein
VEARDVKQALGLVAWIAPAFSAAEIVLLWLLIVATLIAVWRLNRVAGALLLPYLLWVTFAAVLNNFTLWQQNPTLLR